MATTNENGRESNKNKKKNESNDKTKVSKNNDRQEESTNETKNEYRDKLQEGVIEMNKDGQLREVQKLEFW